jgi:SAM-dependent methyltransferase
MDTNKVYDPKTFWDARARRAGINFESAVCLDCPIDNKIIDRIQKRYLRLALKKISDRMILAGKKILDYGCGTGRWVEFFRNYGMCYTGVDISTEMVRISSERFPDAHFSAIDSKRLQFPDDTFDVICSIAVIHHNTYEQQDLILRQLSRMLKYKGFLVLFESIGAKNTQRGVEFPRPITDWWETVKGLGFEQVWSSPTRYFATRTIMSKVLGDNQFSINLSKRIGTYIDPYIGNLLPRRLHSRGTMVFMKVVE